MGLINKKIFVDLDRTLFDTDVFVAEVWHYLGKKYDIDAEDAKSNSKQFYTYDGDLYNYHFFDHLQSLNLGDLDKVEFELTLYLRDQFLIYNDTLKGIDVLEELGGFSILTFGNERYQRLKIACVPELAKYEFISVTEHKKHFFNDSFTEECILIDDKDLASELPDNVDFYRIDRLQPRPVQNHKRYKSIRKLQDIREAIGI